MQKIALSLLLMFSYMTLLGQTQDTNFIFKSSRPLLQNNTGLRDYHNIAGGDFFLTEVGFGFGGHYNKIFNEALLLDFSLNFSGLRNSDEQKVQVQDPETGYVEYRVLNKVNRLYRMPVTVGVKYHLLSKLLGDSFQPYIGGGAGATVIMQLPYEEFANDFFKSLNYATFYIKPTIYLGFGADFGVASKTRTTVYLNYNYTPFGADGIESIRGLPIHNCGGVFLGLRFGVAW
jgi:hypothetical protein